MEGDRMIQEKVVRRCKRRKAFNRIDKAINSHQHAFVGYARAKWQAEKDKARRGEG